MSSLFGEIPEHQKEYYRSESVKAVRNILFLLLLGALGILALVGFATMINNVSPGPL